MLPVFSNMAGFWTLLGVPLLVAIHCLQQRSRSEVVSTLFLLEKLAPESRGGRTWDRWRTSRVFWLQTLAVLLATWVLTGPRWVRGESAQTVVLVLDAAASMEAFHDDAVRAAEAKMAASAGRAARTEWVVLTSDPRQPPLYRGPERAAATAALAAWRPRLGTHDYAPALRLARSLVRDAGETWLITDSNTKVPPDQAAVGVGRPIANVGFAGATTSRTPAGWAWRALLKNNTGSPQHREWWVEQGGTRGAPQRVDLPAGALLELGGVFPEGALECVLALSPDEFTADDRLPLVRPVPKRLTAGIALAGDDAAFFQKLLAGIEGVSTGDPSKAVLRVSRLGPGETPAAGAAILLAPAASPSAPHRLQSAPVVAERDALVADLNWQGLLGPGAAGLKRGPGDEALLWQADAPLAWLRPGDDAARQLVLNFDWGAGNAPRLPAMVLLLRRFVETVRAAQPGFYADNFDAGARVALSSHDQGDGVLTLTFEPASGGAPVTRAVSAAETAVLRAPTETGFFTVSHGSVQRVRGAVQFADARQGDFRDAGTFDTGRGPETKAAWERMTRADPFTSVWLLLLGGALLASWWPPRARGGKSS